MWSVKLYDAALRASTWMRKVNSLITQGSTVQLNYSPSVTHLCRTGDKQHILWLDTWINFPLWLSPHPNCLSAYSLPIQVRNSFKVNSNLVLWHELKDTQLDIIIEWFGLERLLKSLSSFLQLYLAFSWFKSI